MIHFKNFHDVTGITIQDDGTSGTRWTNIVLKHENGDETEIGVFHAGNGSIGIQILPSDRDCD